jgi:photosystem II stability/assembly factor-like uncharacterized protein
VFNSRLIRPSLFGGLFFGLFAIAATGRTDTAPSGLSREQQIADIEKQINDLSKKLADLKSQPATPPPLPPGSLPDGWAKALSWRCIGPATMGGRITALSVFEADPSTYWVATASGGLLKTTNNGITFEHQFDKEATVSVGDVCVAPSNKDIVWVGTGENNPRNSVSFGDGVYKSIDGGKTWKNMGLKPTFQIGKIIVHPKNPDIVYVGALGRLYGTNPDRGVFKTTDGGKTWSKVLFVDDKTGVIDMRMHPTDHETLIVATWERKRDEFDGFFGTPPVPDAYGPIVTHAPGSALYKTSDGGKTFKKLSKGLPTVKLGRIGLDWSRKNPNTVYAIIDTEKAGTGTPPTTIYLGVQGEDAKNGAKLTDITAGSPAEKSGLKAGDIITHLDGKAVTGFDNLFEQLRPRKVGEKVKFIVERGKDKVTIEMTLATRGDDAAGGGRRGGPGGAGSAGGGRGGPGGGRGAGGGQGGAMPPITPGFFASQSEGKMRVVRVMSEAAQKAGINEGDIITAIDGKPVENFRETLQALATTKKVGDKIKVTLDREGKKVDIDVALEEFGGGGGGPMRTNPSRPYSSTLGGQRENVQEQQGKEGVQTGGIYKSTDAGESWTRINSLNPRPMYFSQVRVDPSDEKYLYVCGVSFYYSEDGGKTFRSGRDRGVHSDHHALWIDPRDGRHMIIGTDGGTYQTYDRGVQWDHLNHMALGQFYHVCVDNRRLWNAYGGLQDNGSWGGPGRTLRGTGPCNEDWMSIQGGDGFVCRVDPNDPDLVYAESQGGNIVRRHLKTGERASIRPRPQGGFGSGTNPWRFNWNTPFILSNHNPSIFYCGAQVVFRSVKRGDDLRIISPELTLTKKGSMTAISESPRNQDVIWAGTDDGGLWVTRDGGIKWVNVLDNVKKAGLPGPIWVSTLEASKYAEGRCYVCFDGHRSNNDNPLLYVTEDFGTTWKPIHSNLPWGSTRCLREDIRNENVLYTGTEFAVFASTNRGACWTKINNNLPTVAVHELAQHAITGDMVAATHGRSLWVVDVTPIRQTTETVMKAKSHLFAPVSAVRWRQEPSRAMFRGAERRYFGQNPADGAPLYYALSQPAKTIELKVVDITGKLVRKIEAKNEPGLHAVVWNLSRGSTTQSASPSPGGRALAGMGFGFGQQAAPGVYRVVLTVDGQELSQSLTVEADPSSITNLIAAERMDEEEDEEDKEREERKPDRMDR